jgi:hypothetical protein
MTTHANCTHPATKAARAACRKINADYAAAKAALEAFPYRLESIDAKDVTEGMTLIVPTGHATVKKIGYANAMHRVGWHFTMSQGEPLIFHFHNEKVIRVIAN